MEKEEGAPVFVKIDEYRDVLDILSLIKNKLNEAKATLNKLNQMKNDEDNELEFWHGELEEVEKKVEYIDNTLFEPSI